MNNNLQPEINSKYKLTIKNALFLIFTYSIVFFILTAAIQFIIIKIPNATTKTNKNEQVIEQLQIAYGLSYIKTDDFNSLSSENKSLIDYFKIDENYYLIASKGVFLEDNLIKDFKTLYSKDSLYFYLNSELQLLKLKVDRVGYKGDNKQFLNYYDIENPNFDIQIESARVYTTKTHAFILFSIYLIGVITISLLSYKLLFVEFKKLSPTLTTIGIVIVGVLILFGTNLASGLITLTIKGFTNNNSIISANQLSLEQLLRSKYKFLIIASIVLFAPVVEELVFRKAIFTLAKNQWLGLVISSLLFGLLHVQNEKTFLLIVINLIPYLVSGITLGLLYIKNKQNIWYNIFIHLGWNLFSVIITLFFR